MKTFGYAFAKDIHRHNALALATAARAAFRAACAFDNIPVDATFAVFSDNNPHAAEYDRAMRTYLDYRKAHNV